MKRILNVTFLASAMILAACDGSTGKSGTNALTKATPEPAGANCAGGGVKVEVGMDANNDGVLNDTEVNAQASSYVCSPGDKVALVRTSAVAEGSGCANGGVKIESGIDANANGSLDDAEVVAEKTTYACNGGTPGPNGTISPSTGLAITIKEVSKTAGAPITVRFLLKDDRGFPVDIAGQYSLNAAMSPRFALAYTGKDEKGNVLPLTVYTKSGATPMPTAYNPKGTAAGHGKIEENGMGAGDYTYTFPTDTTTNGAVGVSYDANKLGETHVVWVQAMRQTDLTFPDNANTFYAANQELYYISNGNGTPLKREIVSNDNCSKCHDKFRPETAASNAFHGGGRMAAAFCNVCHNPGRTSNPAADSSVFVHRIHHGEHLQAANVFHNIEATYPQDIRNCGTCHDGAAQGAQAKTAPSLLACGSCHDYVDFKAAAAAACTKPRARDEAGVPVPCNHTGGAQSNNQGCANCHSPDAITGYHKPVVPPNPVNFYITGNSQHVNTNAAYLAADGYVPTGAAVISYDVKSVEAVADDAITPNKRPQITFKLKKNGSDVVFQTYAAGVTTELMPGFVGSPSVYFAFAVPQDGIAKPADFNATAAGYIKNIWNGTAVTTARGELSGPDSAGYYTIKLTGVQIPPSATMLTGGVGYSYNLSTTPPLTQVDLPEYPYNTDGKKQGGLIVPTPNVWKVAAGYTGRRAIVDNAKCLNCHGVLGVAPTFHAGQRNDGPTCSFCHTPNRASSGWQAGSKYFIHAIHAGRKRQVSYTWHATEVGPGYGEIEFPAPLNDCKVCHVANTYDLTATASQQALPNFQLMTAASGVLPSSSSAYYTWSPYPANGSYGDGFSFKGDTGLTVEAAGTTLVHSAVTGICSSCHDSSTAIDHMRANGGSFYATRSQVMAPGAAKEQCMMCHGPGRVAAIGNVHLR